MQILLRLLLPPPPPPPVAKEEEEEEDEERLAGSVPGSFGWQGNLLQQNNGCSEDDVMIGENDWSRVLKCDWCSTTEAVQLLVSKLVSDEDCTARHACEILISIIQNSPIDSFFMKSLTSLPVIERIVRCAVRSGEENEFYPFECPSTYAMHVLEIFLLHLKRQREEKEEQKSNQVVVVGVEPVIAVEEQQEPQKHLVDDRDDDRLERVENHNDLEKEIIVEVHECSNDNVEIEEQPKIQEADTSAIISFLPTILTILSHLLRHPNTKQWTTSTQIHSSRPMLGASRLRIIKLVESMVLLSNPDFDDQLKNSEVLDICLDFFFEFEWSTMLHQSVANSIVHVMEGGPNRYPLQHYYIYKCHLLERLVQIFDQNEAMHENCIDNNDGNQTMYRPGYMGHAIIICQAIQQALSVCKKQESITPTREETSNEPDSNETPQKTEAQRLDCIIESYPFFPQWSTFVSSTLSNDISIQSKPLGGVEEPPKQLTHSADSLLAAANNFDDDDAAGMIEMNESDLDIAASMMDDMRVSDNPGNIVISAEFLDKDYDDDVYGGGHGMNFGTTVDFGESIGQHKQGNYYYDDPLGTRPEFHVDDDHRETTGDSSDDDDEDEKDDVPVMDLFAGNFHIPCSSNNSDSQLREPTSQEFSEFMEASPDQIVTPTTEETEFEDFADFDHANFTDSNDGKQPKQQQLPDNLVQVTSSTTTVDSDNFLFKADFSSFPPSTITAEEDNLFNSSPYSPSAPIPSSSSENEQSFAIQEQNFSDEMLGMDSRGALDDPFGDNGMIRARRPSIDELI